jgi:hypothetical protein
MRDPKKLACDALANLSVLGRLPRDAKMYLHRGRAEVGLLFLR